MTIRPFGIYNDRDGNIIRVDLPPVGAIVRLRSGSTDLTVIDTCTDCGDVEVAYSDGVVIVHDTLPGAALVGVH